MIQPVILARPIQVVAPPQPLPSRMLEQLNSWSEEDKAKLALQCSIAECGGHNDEEYFITKPKEWIPIIEIILKVLRRRKVDIRIQNA